MNANRISLGSIGSKLALHATVADGTMLVHTACALLTLAYIVGDDVPYRAGALAVVLLACIHMRGLVELVDMFGPASLPTMNVLLNAVEIVMLLTVALCCPVADWIAFLLVMTFSALLVSGVAISLLLSSPLHRLLSRGKGRLFASLALGFLVALFFWPRDVIPVITVSVFKVGVGDIAWLVAFLALSGSQFLYERPTRQSGMAIVYAGVPLFIIGISSFFSLVRGISFAVGSCLVMVRQGRSARRAMASCAVFVLLFAALRRYGYHTLIGAGVWPLGSARLASMGAPALAAMFAVSIYALQSGVRSLLRRGDGGIMVPYLCVSWGAELVLELLMTIAAEPSESIRSLPFLVVEDARFAPLLLAIGLGVAIACDLRASFWRTGVAELEGKPCERNTGREMHKSSRMRDAHPSNTEVVEMLIDRRYAEADDDWLDLCSDAWQAAYDKELEAILSTTTELSMTCPGGRLMRMSVLPLLRNCISLLVGEVRNLTDVTVEALCSIPKEGVHGRNPSPEDCLRAARGHMVIALAIARSLRMMVDSKNAPTIDQIDFRRAASSQVGRTMLLMWAYELGHLCDQVENDVITEDAILNWDAKAIAQVAREQGLTLEELERTSLDDLGVELIGEW